MYLWSQTQDMPLTPGILWTKTGKKFNKAVMMNGVSLGQLQWIYAIQESDFVLNNDGSRIQIEHAYHRGEHEENGFKFDGYFEKNGVKFFLEFNGNLVLYLIKFE